MSQDTVELPRRLRVRSGASLRLRDADASRHFGISEVRARAQTARQAERLGELQDRMSADGRFGLLLVLQAMDGGGKDGTVRHVCSAFNPRGCTVTSFKVPSAEELSHDYLWRVHAHAPARGQIAVFNRSHYEDVLIARVQRLVPRATWIGRYAQINDFERMLDENGLQVIKVFLHISRAEQKRRLEERIRNPRKQWKFDPADLDKRAQWGAYRAAYEAAIRRCNTARAPWYVVPADHKWLRDLAVSQILLRHLEALPLRYPRPAFDPRRLRVR